MSAFTCAKLFVDHEQNFKDALQHDTWGHLGPRAGKHKVTLIAGKAPYGADNTYLLSEETPEGLQNSPWSYNWLNEIISEALEAEGYGAYKLEGYVVVGTDPSRDGETEWDWCEETEEDIEVPIENTDLTWVAYELEITETISL